MRQAAGKHPACGRFGWRSRAREFARQQRILPVCEADCQREVKLPFVQGFGKRSVALDTQFYLHSRIKLRELLQGVRQHGCEILRSTNTLWPLIA
jgi:hypothetical protein